MWYINMKKYQKRIHLRNTKQIVYITPGKINTPSTSYPMKYGTQYPQPGKIRETRFVHNMSRLNIRNGHKRPQIIHCNHQRKPKRNTKEYPTHKSCCTKKWISWNYNLTKTSVRTLLVITYNNSQYHQIKGTSTYWSFATITPTQSCQNN